MADKLHELLDAKATKFFDRKAERTAIEKFYTARGYAPLWTEGGRLNATGKGVIARLKDAAADGLNPADYPVPDFAAATSPDRSRKPNQTDRQHDGLCPPRPERPDALVASQRRYSYPEHPTDPDRL